MSAPRVVSRIFSSVLAAFLGALLGAAAAGTLTEPVAAETAPDGVSRIVAATPRYVLFEGAVRFEDGWFVDGRVWLYDRAEARLRLLTSKEDFGEHFFADGALLLADRGQALVLVNFDGDAGNLFLVDLDGTRVRRLADAPSLGLSEVRAETFALSPAGDRVAFTAIEMLPDPASEHGVAWTVAVYSLALDGADPAGSLRLEHRAEYGVGVLPAPVYEADGRVRLRDASVEIAFERVPAPLPAPAAERTR